MVFRLQSHAKEQAKWNEIRGLKRSMAELAARGVTVSLAELRLRKLQEEREAVARLVDVMRRRNRAGDERVLQGLQNPR